MRRGHIDIGVGFSDTDDSLRAGMTAASAAAKEIAGGGQHFALVLMTTSYDHAKTVSGVRSVLSCEVAGVTSSHVIARDKVYSRGVCVLLLHSDDVHVSAIAENLDPKGPLDKQLNAMTTRLIDGNIGKMFTTAVVKVGNSFVQISPYTLMVFSNATRDMNVSRMLRGVLDVSGGIFQIVGGVPGDMFRFDESAHSLNGNVYDCGALLLLISSKVPTGFGIANAWRPVGGAHVITRADDNVVHEIDNLKASRLYENYLSKPISFLQSDEFARLGFLHPLGILLSYGDALVRNPHKVNEDGSVVFNGAIREGCAVRFMTCSRDEVLDAARSAARSAISSLGKAKPAVVFAFISLVDTMLLGADVNKEVQAIQEVVGEHVPVVGIYTLGEYSRESVYAHKLYSNSVSLFVIGH